MRKNKSRTPRPIFFPLITPFVFVFGLAFALSTLEAQQPVEYVWNDSAVVATR